MEIARAADSFIFNRVFRILAARSFTRAGLLSRFDTAAPGLLEQKHVPAVQDDCACLPSSPRTHLLAAILRSRSKATGKPLLEN